MSSSDEENSRDSVNNYNEQSDDHETVISDNQTPPDTEEVEIDAENMEEINQKFVLAAKEGRTSDVIRLWTDNNAFIIDYTSGRDEWSAIHFAASDGNLELVKFLQTLKRMRELQRIWRKQIKSLCWQQRKVGRPTSFAYGLITKQSTLIQLGSIIILPYIMPPRLAIWNWSISSFPIRAMSI